MNKDLRVSVLLDAYGALLPEKQRLLCELYFNEDLSLAEISENEGITRQGAGDLIRRATERLREYERALGVCELCESLRAAADEYRRGGGAEKMLEIIDGLLG